MATKRVNIDIVAKDKSQQALNRVRGGLDRVKASVFNVRNALAGLGAGLVIRNLVNTGKEIESLQVRLKFLFGTAEEGAKAFDNMAKFASKVPFSLEQIQQGAGVLSVISKDADELSDIMEITGNVAAVTGLDFKTASEQIQRSLSAGIASADLFRERGVRDLLGFKAGATVTAEETAEAFKRVFGKGGQFGDATGELALTFEGTLSMIGDKFFTFKKTILEAGFFPELKKQFKDLNKFLEDNGKALDDVATKIGVGLAMAVKGTADAFKFLKENFDSVVLVLQTMVAIKVATFFYGATTALAGLTVGMKAFNFATKKNIIFGSVMVFASAMGFMIGKFREFKGELDTNSMSLKELNKELKEVQKITEEGVGAADFSEVDKYSNALLKEKILLEEIAERTKDLNLENGKAIQQMRDSLKIKKDNNQEDEKEKETLAEINDHMRVKNRLTAEQAGLFDHLNSTTAEHNEHMRVANKLTAEQAGLFDLDKIIEGLKKEEEQLKKTMQVYAEFAMQKRRLSLQTFREEREQAKNNHHKMFDDALANESKMVELKENTKKLTMAKGRELIAELAKNNREMFMINKALAVKDAIMATAQGITNALKLGPIGIPLAAIIGGLGAVQIATIARQQYQGRAGGGSVNKDQAYMVGEKGPEMFVPSGSGKIVPNNQMGNGQPVNVNFNINTVDARGFNELLTNSRGVIVNMINSAVNETGRQAIV